MAAIFQFVMASVLAFIICAVCIWPTSLWTLAIGFAGAPGAFLATIGRHSMPKLAVSLTLCIAGQAYAALAFSGFVIETNRIYLSDKTIWFSIPMWFAAWVVAGQPIYWAQKEEPNPEDEVNPGKWVQLNSVGASSLITNLGFFVIAFWPPVFHYLWPWVPLLQATK